MNKLTSLLLIVVTMFLVAACNNAPESDQATTKAPQKVEEKAKTNTKKVNSMPAGISKYVTNNATSKVTWIGSKPVGKHNGTFKIKDGALMVTNGNIEAASFVIDMKSIEVLDMDAKGNADLAGHLGSPDFFNVAKHPEASFVMTSVKAYDGGNKEDDESTLKIENPTHIITGNLTMLGQAKSIEFPANVSITDNAISAKANFNIDRTNWGITYGNDKSLKDKFISPTVNVGFDINATKS